MTIKVIYSFMSWIFYDLYSVLDRNKIRLKWKINIYNYKHKNIKKVNISSNSTKKRIIQDFKAKKKKKRIQSEFEVEPTQLLKNIWK